MTGIICAIIVLFLIMGFVSWCCFRINYKEYDNYNLSIIFFHPNNDKNVTLDECLKRYTKGQTSIMSNGNVIGFTR
jgi:hypothetical protein